MTCNLCHGAGRIIRERGTEFERSTRCPCDREPAERPRDRAGIRAALDARDARDALRKQPAQLGFAEIGGHGTRTQPSLF